MYVFLISVLDATFFTYPIIFTIVTVALFVETLNVYAYL
jgi:hypothetical protein